MWGLAPVNGQFRVLTGDAMVLSVCAPLPAAELSRRMTAPGPAGRRFSDLAERTAHELGPTERHWFLAAELPAGDDAKVIHEAADLLFHVMVGLTARKIPIERVLAELARRFGTSGHVEKAQRK